jgi:hypothetical protein
MRVGCGHVLALSGAHEQVRNLTRMQLLRTCAGWRPDQLAFRDPVIATKISLKSLSRRLLELGEEIAELDRICRLTGLEITSHTGSELARRWIELSARYAACISAPEGLPQSRLWLMRARRLGLPTVPKCRLGPLPQDNLSLALSFLKLRNEGLSSRAETTALLHFGTTLVHVQVQAADVRTRQLHDHSIGLSIMRSSTSEICASTRAMPVECKILYDGIDCSSRSVVPPTIRRDPLCIRRVVVLSNA